MKLVLDNVSKNFDEKMVLNNISFEFEIGEIYGLLGRNGAGKTTLFNCINNDLDYDGHIYLEDKDEKKDLVSEDIGYSIAEPLVPEFLTGREFLEFFLEINDRRIQTKKTVEEYFDLVGIDRKDMDKLLKDYSFGMKNKMQLLVNIILDSKIILLDEPLTSLDVVAAEEMKNLLKKLKKEHILIFSTHIMELALDLCDEIVILNNGALNLVSEKKLDKKHIIEILKSEE